MASSTDDARSYSNGDGTCMGVLPYRLDGVTRTAVSRTRLRLPPLGLIVGLREVADRDVCPGRPGTAPTAPVTAGGAPGVRGFTGSGPSSAAGIGRSLERGPHSRPRRTTESLGGPHDHCDTSRPDGSDPGRRR